MMSVPVQTYRACKSDALVHPDQAHPLWKAWSFTRGCTWAWVCRDVIALWGGEVVFAGSQALRQSQEFGAFDVFYSLLLSYDIKTCSKSDPFLFLSWRSLLFCFFFCYCVPDCWDKHPDRHLLSRLTPTVWDQSHTFLNDCFVFFPADISFVLTWEAVCSFEVCRYCMTVFLLICSQDARSV